MCPDGQGSQCKSYSELLSLAEEKGGEVGFNIFDYNPVGSEIIQITTPELFNYVIPAVPCSGFREFWVQMWYYDGSSFLPVYGPRSNTVKIECPYKLGPKMMLDIRFDEVKFSSLDDDDSGPQSVEVYGYLRASSETMTRYLNWATWNEQADACPDESPNVGFETGGQLGCPQFFINGIYDLKAKPMCQSELFYECTESGWATNNNTIRLVITEYDSLSLAVKLVDWDDASANDLVCQAKIQLPNQSIYEWHKIKDQKFALTGSLTDSGKCQIKGVMNAVEP
jgi:hypothetical protein